MIIITVYLQSFGFVEGHVAMITLVISDIIVIFQMSIKFLFVGEAAITLRAVEWFVVRVYIQMYHQRGRIHT